MAEMGNNQKTLKELYFEACQNNDTEIVQFCIDKLGLNINCVSEDGLWTGLAICAKNNYLQMLEVLLNVPNVNVNIKSSRKCIDEDDFGKVTSIIVACYYQNHEIVRRLLREPGIDLKYKSGNWKWTAMHWAAWKSDKCCEELAMYPDIEWNCSQKRDFSPLGIAIWNAGNS